MIRSTKVLDDALLEKISGGEVSRGALDAVKGACSLYKRAGYDLDRLKQDLTARFNQDPLMFSTDGSKEDLEELLRVYEETWDQV